MTIPYFDAHCDTVTSVLKYGGSLEKNEYQLDLTRLAAYAPAAQFFAVWGGQYEEKTALLRSELQKAAAASSAGASPRQRPRRSGAR